ncbi:lysylphosphatidylglycerol synthase transmembrane domain-containing protein [Marinoscillum sp.]|uniref:lysylphosphatidylglycerol synthase transmembrane domain-containing protein n=1 Tax=Marinoscillum sp. TaxID=2024838 RepID=UPI003BAAB52E
MIKKATSVFKYAFSLGLALALLYLAFRNVDFSEFIEKSRQVNYTWVIVSILLSLVAYYARAYRWNILLKPLGYPNLNVHKTNLAVLVGYLANLAFPRLGEVTRCGMMKRSDDVPVSTSLGTVITERIIDLFTLIGLILLALVLEYDRLIEFLTNIFSGLQDVEGLMWKAGMLIVIGGASVLILGYVLYVKNDKIRSFIKDLIRGILSLKDVKNRWGFVLSTIVLWVTYYFMSYIIVFSIPETAHLSWVAGIMLLVTGGIALAVPVQGGIGTYHAFISAMLVLYSVEKTTGVFLATLLHTSQIVAIAIFGGIALLASVFIKKNNEPDRTEDRPQK